MGGKEKHRNKKMKLGEKGTLVVSNIDGIKKW